MKKKFGLILVVREESLQDFFDVSNRLIQLDPEIQVIVCDEKIIYEDIPEGFFSLKVCVIYLVNPPPLTFKHELPYISVKHMTKLEEYWLLKKANIPYLPIEPFIWGMSVDSDLYGDWIVLKPKRFQSTGKDINMLPRQSLSSLKPSDFPNDHFIHCDDYYVQRFVKTGSNPFHYRAMIFCGEILYSSTNKSYSTYPDLTTDIPTLLNTTIASNIVGNRERKIVKDERKNRFALKVAKAFPQFPILGVDIVEDEETKELYVMEINAGGNVWHFSSQIVRNMPEHTHEQTEQMLNQYKALDTAAKALLRFVYKQAALKR
jgi:hypothetical protein